MAKKKKGAHRKKGFTLPLAVVAGMAAPGVKMWEARGGGISGVAREAGRIMTGFDFWSGTWNFANMRYGLLPVMAGFAVHWLAGRIGINRAIGRAGIPWIRI